MGILINDNYSLSATKPFDARYMNISTPWTSCAEVIAAIPTYRYQGLTVNINGVEYWWKDGVSDGDLVPKILGDITSVGNGLNLSGNTIILGGDLIENTIIALSGNNFSMFDSNTEFIINSTGITLNGLQIDENGNIIYLSDVVSRNIYVASISGNDNTGDGSEGNPFQTILRAFQDIKTIVKNSTITILLNESGDYPVRLDCQNELAKKTFINSSLYITGNIYNIIESGFTLTKTSNTLFAYTLNKLGLSATTNQYLGDFIGSFSNCYPISYNESGNDAINIEFVHTNLISPTTIISWGVTITNPDLIAYVMDWDFGVNINSFIEIGNLNIDYDTIYYSYEFNACPHYFTRVKFLGSAMDLGAAGGEGPVTTQKFTNCQFIQTLSNAAYMYMYTKNIVTFARCSFYTPYVTQGSISFINNIQTKFTNGVYFHGNGTGSALYTQQGVVNIYFSRGIKVRSFVNIIYNGPNLRISKSNPTSEATMYLESDDVDNIFALEPKPGSYINIEAIYGLLPTTVVNGGGSYKLVDPTNNIFINIAGLNIDGIYFPDSTIQQTALISGDLIEINSSVLTISGGSNSVVGSGTTIEVKSVSNTQDGFLRYSDYVIFSSMTGTTNGLSISGKNIGIGGKLTGDTVISGASKTMYLGISASTLSSLYIESENIVRFQSDLISSDAITCLINKGGDFCLELYNNAIFYDNSISKDGLKYSTCISTGFTNSCSFVDKGYVDNNANIIKINNVNSNYIATQLDDFIGVSGATEICLPITPKIGQRIIVSDICGNALTDNINIIGNGMCINGSNNAIINTNYGTLIFINNGYFWSIVGFIN